MAQVYSPDIIRCLFLTIHTGSVGEYIAKGASSVVLSDAIFDKEAMGQRNFNRIRQLANMAALQCKEAVDRLEFVTFHSNCFWFM